MQRSWLHAHRGASADAPENTLAPFRLRIAQGADAIALDLHITADGTPVVIHDGSLERTTDRYGAVSTLLRMSSRPIPGRA
jgi:glycerophosphoryl diester phosphodiesterase